jgi:hypothetical protein
MATRIPTPHDIDALYGLEPVFEPGEGSDGLAPVVELGCPYCGEVLALQLDLSAGDQSYVEDCQVCCQPMVITVATTGHGTLRDVNARRGDE